MFEIHQKILKNGLKVLLVPMAQTKAVAVLALVAVGSRFEEKREGGLAHFFEHMVFKGTKDYPSTLAIAKKLDAVGASYNAYTSEEATAFHIRAEASHLDLALEMLSQMLGQALLKNEEIAKEKGVIVEEINMIEDHPMRLVDEKAVELLFGDTALGRSALGTKETVLGLGREDFTSWRSRHYTADRMLVVIAGQFQIGEAEKLAEGYFGEFPPKCQGSWQKIVPVQSSPAVKLHFKKTDQAHLFLGFRAPERTDPRRQILKVLNNMLGGMMSSKLFIEVREKRGLAYYIHSDYYDFYDNGVLAASAGVDLKKIDEAVRVIVSEFQKIAVSSFSSHDLAIAKDNLVGELYLGLEDSLSVASFVGEQALFWKKIDQPEDIAAKIQKVTASDIIKLARGIIRPEKLNLAIVGPFAQSEDNRFKKLLTSE